MKKNRQKTADRSHHLGRLGAQQLASVRGGGIQGTGHGAVIHMQNDDGVLHGQS